MKNRLLILVLIFFSFLNSFSQEVNFFNVELADRFSIPKFEKNGAFLIYEGKEKEKINFFNHYKILDFFQTFPDSKRNKTLNVFTFVVQESDFGTKLIQNFPSEFLGFEDMSNFKVELTNTYPNDYGTTSPVTNLGVPHSLKNFDYIGVPKAWDFTEGLTEIKIGISDSNIDENDIDFKYKTTYLPSYYYFDGTNYVNYYNPPYSMSNESWHGTSTAAIAAAQGNNANGMVGVCSNCSIVATRYGYGSPGSYANPTPNLNNLLQLAIAGVKVINMSWTSYSTIAPTSYNYQQWIFDELHDDYGVVCVAAAGNVNSYSASYAPNFILYGYPASYNHVVSVTSVNHKNSNFYDEVVDYSWGPVSWYNEDIISPTGTYVNGVFTSYYEGHTTNDQVDISAPGMYVFQYPWYVLSHVDSSGNPLRYGSGTSGAAPHVSGTFGLMLSLNSCLIPDEAEDILQLTSKNIEANPNNHMFVGRLGSGKLETGDAVEFVSESMNVNGNAIIDGHDFWRFNFNLKHVMNKLTISNQIFRDNNTSDFTAKNVIDVLENSDFKPNNSGFVDLKVDSAIVLCEPSSGRNSSFDKNKKNDEVLSKNILLYPNPNNGNFRISLNDTSINEASIEIYDIYGKLIFSDKSRNQDIDVELPTIANGVYMVKIKTNSSISNLKFIKN